MKKVKLLLTFLLALFIIIPANFRETQANDYTKERQELFDFFTTYGVETDVAYTLVNKYFSGHLLDSMNEEMQQYGVTEEADMLNLLIQKTIYPDGSISISILPQAYSNESGIIPLTVSGGTYKSGSGWWSYTKAKCYESNGVVTVHYHIDYSGDAYSPSKITKIYDDRTTWNIHVFAGSWENPTFHIVRSQATSSNPAQATIIFKVSVPLLGTTNYRVSVFVAGTKAYTATAT
jgi:hypothetical protein